MRRSIALPMAAMVGVSIAVPATAGDKSGDRDAVVCKYEKVVGSRISQKICMSKFEWEDRQRVQVEARRSSQNRNSSCGDEGPC